MGSSRVSLILGEGVSYVRGGPGRTGGVVVPLAIHRTDDKICSRKPRFRCQDLPTRVRGLGAGKPIGFRVNSSVQMLIVLALQRDGSGVDHTSKIGGLPIEVAVFIAIFLVTIAVLYVYDKWF